ncbi:MAG: MinD/ParA family protein [Spirochaetales bacterium]|nr:MinD/ParA family protein [Spirochaetales bacterium]
MHIFPVASGKGGVGKSLFTANLGIALGQAGKKVILADLDLGASNLHLLLGERRPGRGIGYFLNESRTQLVDYVQPTQYKNVSYIPGDSEIPGMANLSAAQKRRLMKSLSNLDTEYLLLDLGAGTSFHTIDFFLMSGAGTLVTTPTPTAIVNGYVFIKTAIFRLLHTACKKGSPGEKILKLLEKESSNFQRLYILDLLKEILRADPDSYERFQALSKRFRPRLVLNMLENPKDADRAYKLRRSCQQYLGLDLDHFGIMYRDELQDTALTSGLPIVVYKPKSVLSQAIYRIADKFIQFELEYEGEDENLVKDTDFGDDSFEAADLEAQLDYESKIEYLEELLHTGALTLGDVMETLKTQQFEVQKLKQENTLLKKKLVEAIERGYLG